MKKIFPFCLFLIGIINNGCNKTSKNDTIIKKETLKFNAIDFGKVQGNQYINEGNNLTFVFPLEWEAIDAKTIHKQKIKTNPGFLTHSDIESIDTVKVLTLYIKEKGKRIKNYDIIEQHLTKEDSIKLKNVVNKEEYYQNNYPDQIESAALYLEFENVKNKPQFKSVEDYMERVRSKMSNLILQDIIRTKNYNIDKNQVSEIYNVKMLPDSTALIGLDINFSQGSSLTGISLKKGDILWNFQLFYFNKKQKEALVKVVESLKQVK